MNRILPGCLLLVVLPSIGGCAEEQPYDTAEVSGTVTLDGKTLPGAYVAFEPIDKHSSSPGSFGRTDQRGRYRLKTISGDPGAVAGRHRVSITLGARGQAPIGDTEMGRPREPLPRRYNYDTKLTCDVPPGGTETADFALVDE